MLSYKDGATSSGFPISVFIYIYLAIRGCCLTAKVLIPMEVC